MSARWFSLLGGERVINGITSVNPSRRRDYHHFTLRHHYGVAAWLDLSLDLGTFRALIRMLSDLAEIPDEMFVGCLLEASSGRFEACKAHVDMLYDAANIRREDKDGNALDKPFRIADLIKLFRRANLLTLKEEGEDRDVSSYVTYVNST